MINALGLANFKCYRSGRLPLSAFTVVTGLNGAGKSTALQALRLARLAAFASPVDTGAPRSVPLNGALGLDLGESADVLSDQASDQRITITVSEADRDYPYQFTVPDGRSLNLPITELPAQAPPTLTRVGRDFTMLSAERLGPRDQNVVSDAEPGQVDVGVSGEFTSQVLAEWERHAVAAPLIHPGTEQFDGVTLRSQTEAWMADIARPVRISAAWPPGVLASVLRFQESDALSEPVRPANMGFGITYALPIVVAGLLSQPGALFLVENPEAHLHPRGQSRMGRFLGRLAGSGVQVITETHSDHVVNGARLAVAVDRTIRPEQASILFMGHGADDGPELTEIGVSAAGNLSAWPDGFFDQIEEDLGGLAVARRQR